MRPVPSFGSRSVDVAPQRQAAAAHHEHEQDQQERDRPLEPGELADAEEVLDVEAVARRPRASPMPMTSPPSSVSGNDRNPPSSAAAIAVTVTMSVNVIVDRLGERGEQHAGDARPAPRPCPR